MKFKFRPAFTIKSELKWYLIKRKDRRNATYVQAEPDEIAITDGFSKESERSSISEISESVTVGANASFSGLFVSGGVDVSYTSS